MMRHMCQGEEEGIRYSMPVYTKTNPAHTHGETGKGLQRERKERRYLG